MGRYRPICGHLGKLYLAPMKRAGLVVVEMMISACSHASPDTATLGRLQTKSPYGQIATWQLDADLSQPDLQQMRDRAYSYCLHQKAADKSCLLDQDTSLFFYANSYRLVRGYRAEANSIYPFAVAHNRDHGAFGRVLKYCLAVYKDQGASDARALGPCVSAGVGSDYFSLVAVP